MKQKIYIPLLILFIGSLCFNVYQYHSNNAEQELYQQNLNGRLRSELTFFASTLEEGKVPSPSTLSSASIIDTLSYYSDMEIDARLGQIIIEKMMNNQPLTKVEKMRDKIRRIQGSPSHEEMIELNILLKK
ncbi:hypothetical protein [Paenibacillus sp. Marseille-Q7038]